MPTITKRKADIRTKSKGLCMFIMVLNLMDLALGKKNKTKRGRKRKVSLPQQDAWPTIGKHLIKNSMNRIVMPILMFSFFWM